MLHTESGSWHSTGRRSARISRIYGKPSETVVTQTPPSPERAVLDSMTLEEKLELLHRLRRGEPVELPVIEGSATTSNELER
jgi:hypothetical protein